jgi:hypothetical protein
VLLNLSFGCLRADATIDFLGEFVLIFPEEPKLGDKFC